MANKTKSVIAGIVSRLAIDNTELAKRMGVSVPRLMQLLNDPRTAVDASKIRAAEDYITQLAVNATATVVGTRVKEHKASSANLTPPDEVWETDMDIDVVRLWYLEVIGKEVPNNKKNDEEWMKKKIQEAS